MVSVVPLALGFVALYVVLVGVATFGDKTVSRHLDAFQFTAALRSGGMLLAIAALLVDGFHLPSPLAALTGLGIGLLSGIATVFYCYAIGRLPVWLVTCFANAYIVVTVLLGVVILHEPLTILKIAGIALTLAGLGLLSYHSQKGKKSSFHVSLPLILIGGYIVLIGVATFLEKPALQHLDPFQLNALDAIGMAAVGIVTALIFDHSLSRQPWSLAGMGLGAMMALGAIFYYLGLNKLPISVAAPIANTYVLIPLALSIVFRDQSITRFKIAGIAATLLGVTLLVV